MSYSGPLGSPSASLLRKLWRCPVLLAEQVGSVGFAGQVSLRPVLRIEVAATKRGGRAFRLLECLEIRNFPLFLKGLFNRFYRSYRLVAVSRMN